MKHKQSQARRQRDPRPTILLFEPDLERHAAVAALLEIRCRVHGAVDLRELGRMEARLYDAAVITARTQAVLPAAALLRRLHPRRLHTRVILIASTTDAAYITSMSDMSPDVLVEDHASVGELLNCIGTVVARAGPRWSRHVVGVVELLCRQDRQTLSVRELARQLAVSRSHLTFVFRRELGIGVREFLVRVKTKLAVLMLRQTDAKLDDIAVQAGFCDASHLSRVLYRSTGRRPGALRRDASDSGSSSWAV